MSEIEAREVSDAGILANFSRNGRRGITIDGQFMPKKPDESLPSFLARARMVISAWHNSKEASRPSEAVLTPDRNKEPDNRPEPVSVPLQQTVQVAETSLEEKLKSHLASLIDEYASVLRTHNTATAEVERTSIHLVSIDRERKKVEKFLKELDGNTQQDASPMGGDLLGEVGQGREGSGEGVG